MTVWYCSMFSAGLSGLQRLVPLLGLLSPHSCWLVPYCPGPLTSCCQQRSLPWSSTLQECRQLCCSFSSLCGTFQHPLCYVSPFMVCHPMLRGNLHGSSSWLVQCYKLGPYKSFWPIWGRQLVIVEWLAEWINLDFTHGQNNVLKILKKKKS